MRGRQKIGYSGIRAGRFDRSILTKLSSLKIAAEKNPHNTFKQAIYIINKIEKNPNKRNPFGQKTFKPQDQRLI